MAQDFPIYLACIWGGGAASLFAIHSLFNPESGLELFARNPALIYVDDYIHDALGPRLFGNRTGIRTVGNPFRSFMRRMPKIWALLLFMALLLSWDVLPVQAESEQATLAELVQHAEAGDRDAQISLGYLYYTGTGVDRDEQQAFYWYLMAAEQGDALAQYFLGDRYYYGRGVSVDYQEASKWYRKAAEQGYDLAQSRLGDMYDLGLGVSQDLREAFNYYIKAAEQGLAWAQFKSGLFYQTGRGVSRDPGQAFTWYARAAEQGNAKAQSRLGGMYHDGAGVTRDIVYGYAWSSLAAAKGDEEAEKNREILAQQLSPSQLGKARQLAVELQYRIDHHHDVPRSKTRRPGTTITILPPPGLE
jgi:TPR repeat protein